MASFLARHPLRDYQQYDRVNRNHGEVKTSQMHRMPLISCCSMLPDLPVMQQTL